VRSSPIWTTTCGSSSTSELSMHIRRSRGGGGSSTTTSADSPSPGTTGGCSATSPQVPPCPSSPGQRSSATRWSQGRHHPMTPTLSTYWTDRRRKQPPSPLNAHVLGLLKTQKCRCVICGDLLLYADQQPQSPHDWNNGYAPPGWRSANSTSPPGLADRTINASSILRHRQLCSSTIGHPRQ
jgi:hypothetical protein